jgi:septal ring factor EnvC (AmiA/AmiB activator)
MTEKIEDMETLLMKKEQEIIDLKQASLKQDAIMASLREKNKELEDELSKWLKNQGPKLKEMEGNQKSLLEEFNKVRRDL